MHSLSQEIFLSSRVLHYRCRLCGHWCRFLHLNDCKILSYAVVEFSGRDGVCRLPDSCPPSLPPSISQSSLLLEVRDDQGESLSSSASPTLTATLATSSCLRLHLSSVAGERRIWQCSSSFVFPFPSIPYSDAPSAPLGASLSSCFAPQVSRGQPQGEKTITKLSWLP